MTINIRDNDQTAPTADPEPETPAGYDPDLMPPPAAETDADDDEMHAETDTDDDEMHAETDTDDDEMHAEIDADDEMDAEVASDDGVESRAQAPELETGSEDEPDTEAGFDEESSLEVETGGYGRSEPVAGSGDEPHLELNTGAYGRPEFGADMYDAPAPGDDGDAELVSETGMAVDEPETPDVVDEVDLRDAPVEVATEAGAVGVYGERWNAIQTSFVDEPRQAVESADLLVTEAMEHLAKTLASQRDSLQAQWHQGEGDEVDTEQLRVVFQDYRAFLFRLLPT